MLKRQIFTESPVKQLPIEDPEICLINDSEEKEIKKIALVLKKLNKTL